MGEVMGREGYDLPGEKHVFIILIHGLYISLDIVLLPFMGLTMKEVKQGNVSCINLYDQDFYCCFQLNSPAVSFQEMMRYSKYCNFCH